MRQYAVVGIVAGILAVSLKADDKATERLPVVQKTAVVDMKAIFDSLKQFDDLRAELTAEKNTMSARAKEIATKAQQLQTDLRKLPRGTTEYADTETKLRKLTRDFQDFRTDSQKQILSKESSDYRSTYKTVSAAIEEHAKAHGFTLVLRFQRNSPDESATPQAVIKHVNRNVVFHDDRLDITDIIIKQLNDDYKKVAAVDADALR